MESKTNKNIYITTRVNKAEKLKIDSVSKMLGYRSTSLFIRSAITEKINKVMTGQANLNNIINKTQNKGL